MVNIIYTGVNDPRTARTIATVDSAPTTTLHFEQTPQANQPNVQETTVVKKEVREENINQARESRSNSRSGKGKSNGAKNPPKPRTTTSAIQSKIDTIENNNIKYTKAIEAEEKIKLSIKDINEKISICEKSGGAASTEYIKMVEEREALYQQYQERVRIRQNAYDCIRRNCTSLENSLNKRTVPLSQNLQNAGKTWRKVVENHSRTNQTLNNNYAEYKKLYESSRVKTTIVETTSTTRVVQTPTETLTPNRTIGTGNLNQGTMTFTQTGESAAAGEAIKGGTPPKVGKATPAGEPAELALRPEPPVNVNKPNMIKVVENPTGLAPTRVNGGVQPVKLTLPNDPSVIIEGEVTQLNESGNAGKFGTGMKAAVTAAAVVGAGVEFANAARAFQNGDMAAGAGHAAMGTGFGAGATGAFLKGTAGEVLRGAGIVTGAALFAHEAWRYGQKGEVMPATVYSVGGISMGIQATRLASVPCLGPTAALGSAAAVGWAVGDVVSKTLITPNTNHSLSYEEAEKLMGHRLPHMAQPLQANYMLGCMEYFNHGYDAISAGTKIPAQWKRLWTSVEGRMADLREDIAKDPQAAYEKGVNGLNYNGKNRANAFLIQEGLWAGAKARSFDDLPRVGNDIHDEAHAAKSDLSQVLLMETAPNSCVNDMMKARLCAFMLRNGAGFTADDLAMAARSNDEVTLATMLLSVKDKETGKARPLINYDTGNWEVSNPTERETLLLPSDMKTEKNMNTLMREAIKNQTAFPLKMSAIYSAFNSEGDMKIDSDILVSVLEDPKTPLLGEGEDRTVEQLPKEERQIVESQSKALLSIVCGNHESGYQFRNWQITPEVVGAVSNLDEAGQRAFLQYATGQGLAQQSPDMLVALETLERGINGANQENPTAALQADEGQVQPQIVESQPQPQAVAETPEPKKEVATEKVSWAVDVNITDPSEHVYKNPVAYERAHARLTGKMYKNVRQKPRYREKDREQMLANIRSLEEQGLLPKGEGGKSNSEVFLYKLQQINLLSNDESGVRVNGQKMRFGSYISDNGKNPTARQAEKLLRKKDLTPQEQESLAATILKAEEIVDDDGKMLMDVHRGNNSSYNKNGTKNFEDVARSHVETISIDQEITGTEQQRAEAKQNVDTMLSVIGELNLPQPKRLDVNSSKAAMLERKQADGATAEQPQADATAEKKGNLLTTLGDSSKGSVNNGAEPIRKQETQYC